MKPLLILAVVGLALLSADRSVSTPQNKHEAVILIGQQMSYRLSVGDPNLCGNGYGYDGIDICNSSSSSNAPVFPVGTVWTKCPPPGYVTPPRIPMAQAIADLMDQGFTVRHVDQNGMMVLMTK